MKAFNLQIIETIVIVVCYIILYFIVKAVVNNFLKKTRLERSRRKMAIRVVQLFTTITAIILITGVWGFKQNEIALFASTIFTALGIGFFAQWSLLSNITSCLLLFFNHPIKIGDIIKVLDKDYPFEGEVTDLTYFFVHLKTENSEVITIPNSILLQKSVSVIEKV